MTIYIRSYTNNIEISPKNWKSWEKSGRPIIKEHNGSLFVGRGKNYDCIDYCKITARS